MDEGLLAILEEAAWLVLDVCCAVCACGGAEAACLLEALAEVDRGSGACCGVAFWPGCASWASEGAAYWWPCQMPSGGAEPAEG